MQINPLIFSLLVFPNTPNETLHNCGILKQSSSRICGDSSSISLCQPGFDRATRAVSILHQFSVHHWSRSIHQEIEHSTRFPSILHDFRLFDWWCDLFESVSVHPLGILSIDTTKDVLCLWEVLETMSPNNDPVYSSRIHRWYYFLTFRYYNVTYWPQTTDRTVKKSSHRGPSMSILPESWSFFTTTFPFTTSWE